MGMGGATVGLGDSFLSSAENPSGMAMTLDNADLNFSSNEVRDASVQNYSNPLLLNNYGLAMNLYPWGLSAGYVTTYREGQGYLLPSNPAVPTKLGIQVTEFRLAAARLFEIQDHFFSLGVGLNFGTAEETLDTSVGQSSALGMTVGGMYQLPHRVLIGISYRPEMRYGAPVSPSAITASILPGFYQGIHVPGRFDVGLGWIPNRFFRGSASLGFIGEASGAALLRDEQIQTGGSLTIQPKAGMAYTFIDYRSSHAVMYGGSYLESSRIQGQASRLHATLGVEGRLWFLTAGIGTDISANYLNNTVAVGIDAIHLLEILDLIPRTWHAPYGGFFPDPFHMSDVGLARPLVKDWHSRGPAMNPIQIGLDIPARAQRKFEELKEQLEGTAPIKTKKSPKKKTKKKRKPKGTRSHSTT